MRKNLARAGTLVCVLVAAICPAAGAAVVTLQPQPEAARTFSTSSHGWTSAIDRDGLGCALIVACPDADAVYRSAGGTGGASDGHLRSRMDTLLTLAGSAAVTWTSPAFTAPADVDRATLSLAVRADLDTTLELIGRVDVELRLRDTASGDVTSLGVVPVTDRTWSRVEATVPPGLLQSGRLYAIELSSQVASVAKVASSSTVDFDDVELRLVDALPPSGLEATVPADGPSRVTGSVNPNGQTTTVVVRYGTVPGRYDASTAPATVDGSGAQAFSIPLAGLAPGTLYHYSVVATNADGSASTAEASFLAPVAPSDAPPAVTGAGNRRDRTATFDVAGDVVAARVEVLDASGTVAGRFDDAALDGTEPFVLPDADGTYRVRVVRTSGAGLSSESAAVPVILDRDAPSTSAVALAVRPQVSADPLRTVTFSAPADAVSARVQVLDGAGNPVGHPVPATAGTATVQLGAADGDYRVLLTIVDAAGNEASVLSGAVTLDGTAPGGGAPTVTGGGGDRERTVSFDRDPTATTATIEVLDADGTVVESVDVLAGDTAAITLPDRDGDYFVRVVQSDAAGNSATSPATPVTLDRVPPLPGGAPSVTGPADERERVVRFERAADAASATVEIVSDGVVVGRVDVPSGDEATITLPDADGDYEVRVRLQNAAGNAATSPGTTVPLQRDDTPTGGDSGAPDDSDGPGGSGGSVLSETALRCTRRRVAIIDVARRGGRVWIEGAAARSLAGRTVRIHVAGSRRAVGRALVRGSGRFALRVPPPRGDAARTRYVARVQGEASQAIKYSRRVTLRIASKRGRRVVLAGAVAAPRAGRSQVVHIRRQLTCTRTAVVRRVRTDARGRFRAVVRLPRGSRVATYKAQTRVPARPGGRKLFGSFSLPRIVVR